ncbi:MAG: patatin-like phospholipase family protein [Candidatus Zixiibacteriota bacterium]|nr:MAG: patatin-like phospholipase family protein [candidate division Zixibacteria bacterium]
MPETPEQERKEGVGLALSGGGFRATLFHIGSLWRLNELGWLKKLSEVTSVSGGSITAAYLGYRWKDLTFDTEGVAQDFKDKVVLPLREFCSHTADVGSIIGGIIGPFVHPSQLLARKYRKRLFGDATLQDLPSDEEGPRFTIYATSLQTGVSVRFSRPYMADYLVGMIDSPDVSLAQAVAASSAFPPVFCPVSLKRDVESWRKVGGADLHGNAKLRSKMLLVDGGVYDNLALERVWDDYTTVLVSDAGAPFDVMERSWKVRMSQIFRTIRVLGIIAEQTRRLRRRVLMDFYTSGAMAGAYWNIGSKTGNYKLEQAGLPGPIVEDCEGTTEMSEIRTRLNSFSAEEQEQLINWGYALNDTAMRRWVLGLSIQPGTLPYPDRAF